MLIFLQDSLFSVCPFAIRKNVTVQKVCGDGFLLFYGNFLDKTSIWSNHKKIWRNPVEGSGNSINFNICLVGRMCAVDDTKLLRAFIYLEKSADEKEIIITINYEYPYSGILFLGLSLIMLLNFFCKTETAVN